MENLTLCQKETTTEALRTLENQTGSDKKDFTTDILSQRESEKETPIIKSGKVYLITNLINNKKYIGVTTKTLKRRFRQHHSQCKKRYKGVLHHAINKYGIENFKIETVEECADITEEQLFLKESYYIDKYNTWFDNGHGYNMEKYGGGKFFYSNETRRKMSELKGEKNHNADLSARKFKNLRTGEEFCGHRHEFRKRYNLKQQGVDNIIAGWKKSTRGWIVA